MPTPLADINPPELWLIRRFAGSCCFSQVAWQSRIVAWADCLGIFGQSCVKVCILGDNLLFATSAMGDPRNKLTNFSASMKLNERQFQCMALVAKGMTSKEIARELGISPSTVDNHIRAVIDRIGSANRLDAARFVLSQESEPDSGLASVEPNPLLAPDSGAIGEHSGDQFKLGQFPPLGGSRNDLRITGRLAHVAQIALIGTMVMAAITATIAGLVGLFSR